MDGLDGTPRYRRLTLRGEGGKRITWTGMTWLDGDTVKGTQRCDVKGGGIALHVLVATPADVLKVERQNPRYETWEVVT